MSQPSSSQSPNRSEKRVLWEMRERYNLQPKKAVKSTVAKPPSPPHSAPPQRPSSPTPKPKKRRSWRVARTIILLIIALGLVGSSAFAYKVLTASNKISSANRSIFGQLTDLFTASGQKLKGEQEDRINLLLLAVGGEGHSGQNLTDTIMIASIRPSDHTVALLSIPRDLYVQIPGETFYSKINAVHAYGEAKGKDQGPEFITKKIEEITGLTMDYYVRVDFTAFKSIVDAVGGVKITIPNSFFDYWHKISFPAGTEDMNGDRALAYVRARYIEGPEGGDFQRTHRQQQALLALRDKVFSVSTAFDFTTLNKIFDSLSNNIRTDLQLWEMKRLFEIARQVNHDKVRSVVLSNGIHGQLVGGTEVLGGQPASVLKTRTGDWSEIQTIAKNMFNDTVGHTLAPTPDNAELLPVVSDQPAAASPSPTPSPKPSASATPSTVKATAEVRNGTTITGLAKKIADQLKASGYTIVAVGNATNRSATKTSVIMLQSDQQEAANAIAHTLSTTLDDQKPTGEAASKADVLVILGSDAAK